MRFPDLPENWLDPIKAVKNAGGLLIADEVQPGFGRIGSHMWGHKYQVTPDVVTQEKPMGNGHLLRIITTDIISAFRTSFHSIHLVATLYPWPQRTQYWMLLKLKT